MEFEKILKKAKNGDEESLHNITKMYQPLILKNAIVDGRLDEDLFQELIKTLINCVRKFKL